MTKKIIRVEIEVDDCVHCPDGAEDLSDLLCGIGDGAVDGRVTITDSPIVPDELSYVVPAAPELDGVVVVWNIDGLGPVLPLEGLLVAFRDFKIDKVDNGADTMAEAIELINEISQLVAMCFSLRGQFRGVGRLAYRACGQLGNTFDNPHGIPWTSAPNVVYLQYKTRGTKATQQSEHNGSFSGTAESVDGPTRLG